MNRRVFSVFFLTLIIVGGMAGSMVEACQERTDSPEARPQGRGIGRGGNNAALDETNLTQAALLVMACLNTDGDGEISAQEIANASKSLLSLDSDKDGGLSRKELLPAQRPMGDRNEATSSTTEQLPADSIPGRSRSGVDYMSIFMKNDRDQDGQISRNEAPERLRAGVGFNLIDTNQDGLIDKDELQVLHHRIMDRRENDAENEGQRNNDTIREPPGYSGAGSDAVSKTSIVEIDWSRSNTVDRDLAKIADPGGLKRLNLALTRITDKGLNQLAGFLQLEELDLSGTVVTDDGLEALATLTKLRKLSLARGAVTGTGFQGLKSLRELRIPNAGITDAGMTGLVNLQQLEVLYLSRNQVSDAGFSHLSGLPRLRELRIAGTKVTSASLPLITSIKSLQVLDLRRTAISDADIEKLRMRLPSLTVYQ